MKKIKFILLLTIIFSLTGCFNDDSMESIEISTSVYPIEFVVNELYGEHAKIYSIYPNDEEIVDFEVTDTLLDQYSNSDLFIFNGLSDESNYVKTMLKNNKDLKIIDVSSNMQVNYSMEEIWLDPNNLLTIANNIKKGFEEYISSSYLVKNIDELYEELKINLTALDGKYYKTVKNSSNKTIIVNDNAFMYLKKYGLEVISLDPETVTQKEIVRALELLRNGTCNYVFINHGQTKDSIVDDIKNGAEFNTAELFTMTNLSNVDTLKNDYIALMNQNLEALKLELYK